VNLDKNPLVYSELGIDSFFPFEVVLLLTRVACNRITFAMMITIPMGLRKASHSKPTSVTVMIGSDREEDIGITTEARPTAKASCFRMNPLTSVRTIMKKVIDENKNSTCVKRFEFAVGKSTD
jgi:hypothetical protein